MNSIACKLTTVAIFAVFAYVVFAEPDDASQTEEIAQANAPACNGNVLVIQGF